MLKLIDVKCPACEYVYGVEVDEQGYGEGWEECPNCELPYWAVPWIYKLLNKISDLEEENKLLKEKLSDWESG